MVTHTTHLQALVADALEQIQELPALIRTAQDFRTRQHLRARLAARRAFVDRWQLPPEALPVPTDLYTLSQTLTQYLHSVCPKTPIAPGPNRRPNS